MVTVDCPGRCGGTIRLLATIGQQAGALAEVHVTLTAEPWDLRGHAACVTPPPDGEPLPRAA